MGSNRVGCGLPLFDLLCISARWGSGSEWLRSGSKHLVIHVRGTLSALGGQLYRRYCGIFRSNVWFTSSIRRMVALTHIP